MNELIELATIAPSDLTENEIETRIITLITKEMTKVDRKVQTCEINQQNEFSRFHKEIEWL